MKDEKMNKKQSTNQFCKNCEEPLILVHHIEYDGMTGSYEPYYNCPAGCIYPEYEDTELNAEELAERNKVDTNTNYGIISLDQLEGAIIL